jgi:FlaA1/EpsC-like NDP-sugar epimerase
VLELLALVFIGTYHGETTRVSIPAAILSLLASLAIAILSHYEHTRSRRPSFLLAFYLCLTVLFRTAMARTYWSLETYRTVASIAIAALVVQIVMAVLENGGKQQKSNEDQIRNGSHEETAGFFSRSLFLWLNRLLWTGYQRTLTAPDLQPIDQILYSSRLSTRFASISTPNTGKCA